MTSKHLIRFSAFCVSIHLLGHLIGHLNWDDETGPLFFVVQQMKSHSAVFMGATKTLADYYQGYSLILLGVFGMSIAILWILSNHVAVAPKLVKQILWPLGFLYIFFGVVEYMYFFPFAAIISTLVGVSALLGMMMIKDIR